MPAHQDRKLVFAGLRPAEIDALREWFCHTKPLGPSISISATAGCGGHTDFCAVVAGNEPGSAEKIYAEPAAASVSKKESDV
jgi:hypothetical protein